MKQLKTRELASLLVALAVAMTPSVFGADQPQKGKIKVFLLAGQSNMDGRGDGSKLSAEDKERLTRAQDHIQFAYNHKPVIPLDVTVPESHIAKKFNLKLTFGPELFFGLGLSEALPDDQILFIKRSIGGTSLYGCWNADWSAEKASVMKEEKKPKLYRDFTTYIRKVLSEYKEDEYKICAMLWVQGEADSNVAKNGPKPAETYGMNLKSLINAVRKDMGVKDLPFMMLQVGSGKVVKGMQETAKTMKNVSFIPQSKDPESPAYLPGYGPPTGHYNYEGMKRIGTQFADTFLREYSKSTTK